LRQKQVLDKLNPVEIAFAIEGGKRAVCVNIFHT